VKRARSPRFLPRRFAIRRQQKTKFSFYPNLFWLARERAGGMEALHDRSSRPRRGPRRLPDGRVAFIAAMW